METAISTAPRASENLKRDLGISLGLHVAIFLIFTVKTVFFTGEDLVYQSAVRVDLVALPDKIDPERAPPPIAPPDEKKPEAKEPPKPESKKTKTETKETAAPVKINPKQKEKDAFNKLKAMDAIDKLKEESTANKAAASKKQSGEVKFKGNVLSAGTELTGLNRLQHEEYIAGLDRHIKENWVLPEWLANKNLSAQIRIRIDDKGQLISKQLVKSSGNPSYDDKVKSAIDLSVPFPPPPEKFRDIVSITGILIGFPE